jgi:hypothetical protein
LLDDVVAPEPEGVQIPEEPSTPFTVEPPILNPAFSDPTDPSAPTFDQGLIERIEENPQLANAVNEDPDLARALEQDPAQVEQIEQDLGLAQPSGVTEPPPGVTEPAGVTDPALAEPPPPEPPPPDQDLDDTPGP